MGLRADRCLFTKLLCELILWVDAQEGYEIALDEVTEHITKKDPTSDHKTGSFHHSGLAADLNLYKDGVYMSTTTDHKFIGDHWKSMHPKCTWGGKWEDGNHYSFGEGKQ